MFYARQCSMVKSDSVINPLTVDMSPFSGAGIESVKWEKLPSIRCNKVQGRQDEVNLILCTEPGQVKMCCTWLDYLNTQHCQNVMD